MPNDFTYSVYEVTLRSQLTLCNQRESHRGRNKRKTATEAHSCTILSDVKTARDFLKLL